MYNNNLQQPYFYNSWRNSTGLDPRALNIPQQQGWSGVPVQGLLKGHPVSSVDEAKAAQIDLDGSLFLFPDMTNHKIYVKSINPDGTAAFRIFALDESAATAAETAYVTKAELEAALAALKGGSEAAAAQSKKFNI